MKKASRVLIIGSMFMFLTVPALALPLDLSTFTAEPGVVRSGGGINFTEDFNSNAWYFFDDSFSVPNDATTLSFDYDFSLGSGDFDDFLTFELDFSPELDVFADITGGHFEIDLSPLQGQTISLAWGLIWGGDFDAETTARVYNIDLASAAAPVPEPATILLMGAGLAGLFGFGKRKIFNKP